MIFFLFLSLCVYYSTYWPESQALFSFSFPLDINDLAAWVAIDDETAGILLSRAFSYETYDYIR